MVKEFKGCNIQSDEQVDTTIDSEEHVGARNWLRKNSAETFDAISDSEKLVVDGSDPKSDPSVATHTTNGISYTHTTNGISTHKLFIKTTIQAVVQPITPLVTVEVEVAQKSLSPCQTVLPQANVTDAARPCARIFLTARNVIGTERDRVMPRDASSSKTRSRASCQILVFVAISVSPTRIGTAGRGRNTEPFNASINGFSVLNEHSTSYFSAVSDVETVSAEVADVNPR